MDQGKEMYAPSEPSVYDQLESLNYDVDELTSLLSTLRQKVPSTLVPTVSSLASRFEQLSSTWQGFCLDSYERVSEEQRKLQQGLRRKQSQDTERRRNIAVREAEMVVKEKEFQKSLKRVKDLWEMNETQMDEVFRSHRETHQQLKKDGEDRLISVEKEMSEALGTSPPHLRRGFKLDLGHVKTDDSQRKITSNSDTSYKYSADRTVHGSPGDEDLVSHRSAFIDDGDISARKGGRQLSDERVNLIPPMIQKAKKQEQAMEKSESFSWAEYDKAYDEMRGGVQEGEAGPNISMEKQPSAWDSALESESDSSISITPQDIHHAIQVLISAGLLTAEDDVISQVTDPNSSKREVTYRQLIVQMAEMYCQGKIRKPEVKVLKPDNSRNYNAPFAPLDNFKPRKRVQELVDISHISHAEDVSDFAATSPKHLMMFISEDPTKTMLSSEQVSARNRRTGELSIGEREAEISKELEELLACDSSQESDAEPKGHEFGLRIPGGNQEDD